MHLRVWDLYYFFLTFKKGEKLIQKLEESNKKKQQTSVQENRPIENQDFDFADMHQILKDEQEGIKKSQQEAERRKKTKMTNKKRQKQLLQEVQQLENVFSHPSFVADPINTIQQHLTNKVKLSNKSDNSLPKTLSNQGGVKKVKRKVKLIRRDVTGLRNIEKMSGIKRKR